MGRPPGVERQLAGARGAPSRRAGDGAARRAAASRARSCWRRARRYSTPPVFAVHSTTGLGAASRQFHAVVRSSPAHRDRPRPVVLNTWEAVYFDHDFDTLSRLAERAAAVGVERFVLDDGWFGGRRDDTAGLGDWWVSPDAHPQGLGSADRAGARARHGVRHLGRAGDGQPRQRPVPRPSGLGARRPRLRAGARSPPTRPRPHHPRRLRRDPRPPRRPARRPRHRVRQVGHEPRPRPGHRRDGRAGTHAQTLALYRLLDELRRRHPDVEFESCSSGGARIDLGILQRAERVWTSDCNDALERQTIQRHASMLIPPEVMGAHVGPPTAHTTGRTQTLAFRAATALFGHFGIEWNLLDARRRRARRAGRLGRAVQAPPRPAARRRRRAHRPRRPARPRPRRARRRPAPAP